MSRRRASPEIVRLVCTRETFLPSRTEGIRWWQREEWPDYFRAAQGMWPGREPLSREEWDRALFDGYTYCAALVDGRSVATAAVWRRSEDEWEVAAVGTAPAFRRRGWGRGVVSFVTGFILDAGRTATLHARSANAAMLRTAESVGFRRA